MVHSRLMAHRYTSFFIYIYVPMVGDLSGVCVQLGRIVEYFNLKRVLCVIYLKGSYDGVLSKLNLFWTLFISLVIC